MATSQGNGFSKGSQPVPNWSSWSQSSGSGNNSQRDQQQQAFVVQNIGLQLVNNYYELSATRSSTNTTQVAFSQGSQQQMTTVGQGVQTFRPGAQFMAGIVQSESSSVVNVNQANGVMGAKRSYDNQSSTNPVQLSSAPVVAKVCRPNANDGVPITCNFCGRQFGSKDEAYQHLKMFHIIDTGRGWAPKAPTPTQSALQCTGATPRNSGDEVRAAGINSLGDNAGNLFASNGQTRQPILPSNRLKSSLQSKQDNRGFVGGYGTNHIAQQVAESLPSTFREPNCLNSQLQVPVSELSSNTVLSNNESGTSDELTDMYQQQPNFSIFQPSEESQRIKVLSVTSLAAPSVKSEEQTQDVEIRAKSSSNATASHKKTGPVKGKGKKSGTLAAQLSTSSLPAAAVQEIRNTLNELIKEKVKRNVAIKQKRKTVQDHGHNKKAQTRKETEPVASGLRVQSDFVSQAASLNQSKDVAAEKESVGQLTTPSTENIPETLSVTDNSNSTSSASVEGFDVPTPVLIAETSEEPGSQAQEIAVEQSASIVEFSGLLQSSTSSQESVEKDCPDAALETQVEDVSRAVNTENVARTIKTTTEKCSSQEILEAKSSDVDTEHRFSAKGDEVEMDTDEVGAEETESPAECSNIEEPLSNTTLGETCAEASNIAALNGSETSSGSVPVDGDNSVNDISASVEKVSQLRCKVTEASETSQPRKVTKTKRADAANSPADNSPADLRNDVPVTDTSHHMCSHCPESFQSDLDYLAHLQKKHHGEVSKVLRASRIYIDQGNNVSVSVPNSEKAQAAPNAMTRTTPNKCDICGRHFHTVRSLQGHYFALHAKKKTGKQPVRCSSCNLLLQSPSEFVKHRMVCGWFWDKSNLFRCKRCGKQFRRKRSVFGHLGSCNMKKNVNVDPNYSNETKETKDTNQGHFGESSSSSSTTTESGSLNFRFSARVVQKRAIEKQISDFFKDKPTDRLGLLKPVLNRNVCSGCGTEFSNFKDLARHLSIERVWNCSLRVSKPFLSQILFESGQHVELSLFGSPKKQCSEQRNTATIRRLLKSIKDNADDMSSLLRKMSAAEKVSEVTSKILCVIQSNAGRLSESWISDSFETSDLSRYFLDCISIFCQPIMMDFKSVNPIWAQIRSRASFIVKTANEVRVRAYCVGREQRECNQAVNSALQELVSVFAKQKELTTFENSVEKLLLC